jgi:hypothetical protein
MNLITGDSHSNNIFFKNSTHILCSAVSAKGLNNPNSISQANNILINNIKNNNYVNLFFLFGGVDVDFCFIHKYLDNINIDYKDFNLNVINNYLNFITDNFYDKSVTILSVGLPCLADEHYINGMLNGHINYLEEQDLNILKNKLKNCEVLPNIYKRTEITLHFNEMLKEEIRKLNKPNIRYLDITTFTYNCNLKRINNEYFTRSDHHNYNRNIHFNKLIDEYLNLTSTF